MRVPAVSIPGVEAGGITPQPCRNARDVSFPSLTSIEVGAEAFPCRVRSIHARRDLRIDFAFMMASRSSSLNCCVNIFLVESGISRLSSLNRRVGSADRRGPVSIFRNDAGRQKHRAIVSVHFRVSSYQVTKRCLLAKKKL